MLFQALLQRRPASIQLAFFRAAKEGACRPVAELRLLRSDGGREQAPGHPHVLPAVELELAFAHRVPSAGVVGATGHDVRFENPTPRSAGEPFVLEELGSDGCVGTAGGRRAVLHFGPHGALGIKHSPEVLVLLRKCNANASEGACFDFHPVDSPKVNGIKLSFKLQLPVAYTLLLLFGNNNGIYNNMIILLT